MQMVTHKEVEASDEAVVATLFLLTHFFDEDDVGLRATVFDLRLEVFSKAQAKLNWDLFDKTVVEVAKMARNARVAGCNSNGPLHETWKDLLFTHSF
eukprot:6143702-Karenia_brevis.AAC.1